MWKMGEKNGQNENQLRCLHFFFIDNNFWLCKQLSATVDIQLTFSQNMPKERGY